MYILYGGCFTRATLVEMVMLEGDTPYELREVDIVNWMPALITPDGQALYETAALNLYLTEQHGLTHLAPSIDEPERGLFLSRLFSVHDDLEPIMKLYFYPHRSVLDEKDTLTIKQLAFESDLAYLKVVDARLTRDGPYHLGKRFSLVDLAMLFWTIYIDARGALESLPAVKQCTDLVTARPKISHKFREQTEQRVEYEQMQARSEGVK